MLLDSRRCGSATPGFRIEARGATVYIDPYRVPGRRAAGRPDPDHPRPLRPLLARRTSSGSRTTGRGWSRRRRRRAGRRAGARRSRRASAGARARPRHRRRARSPPTTPRSATPTATLFHPREAGWVGFDLNVRGERLYHSGDTDVIPEMDAVVGRRRRAAAGQRHLRDDRRRGGRGGAPDPAAGRGADALGRAHRHARADAEAFAEPARCDGPDHWSPLALARLAMRRRLRSSRALRPLAWGAVAVGVAAPLVRHRLRLRRRSSPRSACRRRSRSRWRLRARALRDAGIYALQMWAYYAHYDMPDDDPERAAARARGSTTRSRSTALIGGGELPTARLQRALGRPGRGAAARPRAVDASTGLVPRPARHGRLPAAVPPRQVRRARAALIGGDLRPRPASSTGRSRRRRPGTRPRPAGSRRCGGSWSRPASASGKRLWRPLYDSLEGNPFAAMPSLALRHIGHGRPRALGGRPGAGRAGLGLRPDARLRPGLPRASTTSST